MDLHNSKKISLYAISRELDRLSQFKVMESDFPEERQRLVSYTWNTLNGSKKDTPNGVAFDRFLDTLLKHKPETMGRLAQDSFAKITKSGIQSHASHLLSHAGMNLDMVNYSVRTDVSDLVCSLEKFHDLVHRSESGDERSFAETLKAHEADIQHALSQSNSEIGVTKFAELLLSNYVQGFDMDRITFGKSAAYGESLYANASASKILESIQSAVKFDLKSMGVDTTHYPEARNIASDRVGRAENMMAEQTFMEKLASKFRRKNQEVGYTNPSGLQGPM